MNKKSKIQIFVGQRVKALRHELNLTQRQFGEKINRSCSFVSNRENPNNKDSFGIDILNEIAKAFKISLRYFMPDEDWL